MAHFNGTEFSLYIDAATDVQYDEQSELTIDITAATIDYTSKDSGGWAENDYGLRSWSGSASLIVNFQEASKKQWKDVFAAINSRATLNIIAKKGTEATLDVALSGTIKVDSLSITAPMEDKVTCSFSFTGTGALAQTIAA
jgi:TP901-1 family phage major tail protein